MKRLNRTTLIVFIIAVLASCDLPRSSQEVCDCRFMEGELAGEYSRLDAAPPHFNEIEFWDKVLSSNPDPEYDSAFRAGKTHWYQNNVGESVACRVIDGSDQMDAYIILSADESQLEPLDARIIGWEGAPPRLFWERC